MDLRPLNVLIGPNASGKSNLIESLAILRATAGDLQGAIREGGGINEYLWKGVKSPFAIVESVVSFSVTLVEHRLELGPASAAVEVCGEYMSLLAVEANTAEWEEIYAFPGVLPVLSAWEGQGRRIATNVDDLKVGQSILSQRRDPVRFPELTYLSDQFSRISLFQDWNSGRRSAARLPQPTDLPSDFLLPDASNLGLVLHDLWQTSAKRDELISYLRRFYEPARFISTKIQGGTIQLYIEEEGGRLIPATRLSDGTLRYLCLLAILCHPNPPPVIGIEEPELGLHPDIIPTIAELLRKASERTQLFVTTHSDTLVSALSDVPESILVCEATPDGTTMKRLEAEPLREWLEKYSLGELWRMGEIGGNRW